jgi:hypothetical protein
MKRLGIYTKTRLRERAKTLLDSGAISAAYLRSAPVKYLDKSTVRRELWTLRKAMHELDEIEAELQRRAAVEYCA